MIYSNENWEGNAEITSKTSYTSGNAVIRRRTAVPLFRPKTSSRVMGDVCNNRRNLDLTGDVLSLCVNESQVCTDIPVLDDLFSELTSDVPFDCGSNSGSKDHRKNHDNDIHNMGNGLCSLDADDSVLNLFNAVGGMAGDFCAKSEPIDLADMERILLSPQRSKRASFARQPFSARLTSLPPSYSSSTSGNLFDENDFPQEPACVTVATSGSGSGRAAGAGDENPFMVPSASMAATHTDFDPSLMLWDGLISDLTSDSNTTHPQSTPMIHLQDAAASGLPSGNIAIKIIGSGSGNGNGMRSGGVIGNGAHCQQQPRLQSHPQAEYLQGALKRAKMAHDSALNSTAPTRLFSPSSYNAAQAPAPSCHRLPYIPAPNRSKAAITYRTYGKKRYVIGPEYADFVSRLQNDIPFDSSEDEEDDEDFYASKSNGVFKEEDCEKNNSDLESDEGDIEEEEQNSVKISAQELLELFEDQCAAANYSSNASCNSTAAQGSNSTALSSAKHPSSSTASISAFLTHRKHQIGLKGYQSHLKASHATTSPLMSQSQFDLLRRQVQGHFQFLIQNLALANEIENGEGVTLISLKLLVQLHLHLDSTCKLLRQATASESSGGEYRADCHGIDGGAKSLVTTSAAPSATTVFSPLSLPRNLSASTISCLNGPTQRRPNPIQSRLSSLIPAGISKVAIIAGFLARPGQKQFLSLAALRSDSTLKPKSSCFPLGLRVKAHPQLNPNSSHHPQRHGSLSHHNSSSGSAIQLLSNAFYNIITLFHDYIDSKVLESTVNVEILSKYLEMPNLPEDSLLMIPDYHHFANNTATLTNPSRTAKFLNSEDRLLLCGLKRYGCGNWENIQAQFLPCRAARQLAIRYKNLSSRREPMNPIKEFNEGMMMPLNEIEEDLLYKGVQRFGSQFDLISQHYLPHRPATVLRKLWKAMNEARKKSLWP